jgi:hypothetical protein
MSPKPERKDEVLEVFRALSLEAPEDRRRLRLLPALEDIGEKLRVSRYERAETRNNTAVEEDGAQLERAS